MRKCTGGETSPPPGVYADKDNFPEELAVNQISRDQDRLLDEAIDLIIRYQNDPDNSVTVEMIRSWRGRSTDNEAAWLRVAKIHDASGILLVEKQKRERRDALGLTRRKLMISGFGLAALGTAAYTAGPGLLGNPKADFRTAQGEMREIDLPDGSKAVLGPESAIALDFRMGRRSIELFSGMSFFDVREDTRRPFSVSVNTLRATATLGAFDVSSDAGIFSLGVDHGLVNVRFSNAAVGMISSLGSGDWIAIDPSSGTIDRGKRDADQIGSWRNKVIIAERETIAALAARIGRWMPGRIVIADTSIGKERVSGVYDVSTPLLALEAVVHPAGAKVRQLTPYLTIVSPI